jgi:hypothetical protein
MKTKNQPQEEKTEEKNVNLLAQGFIVNYFEKRFSKIPFYSHTNAINTYDNRWRVNVYTKESGFITKFKIVNSFFVIYEKNKIKSDPIVN